MTLSKPKALVSTLRSHCRKTRGYLERKQLQRPQETSSLDYAPFSLLSHPQPPADLPDLVPLLQVSTQQRAAVPSPPNSAPGPTGTEEGKGELGGGRPSFPTPPAVFHPHSPASPASPLGEWFAAARRALALALGTARAAAGTAGAQRRTGVGAARFAYAVGGAGWGRANGRPPGATPRGAIRPPRSGPGPAPRALHFLGAF